MFCVRGHELHREAMNVPDGRDEVPMTLESPAERCGYHALDVVVSQLSGFTSKYRSLLGL